MSRLTRNGTAKSFSRNQIFRRERGQGFFSLVSLSCEQDGNLPVALYSAIICYDNNKNNNCCSVYPQLPPVIGAPWGYYGRGFLFPVDYGSVGVHLT